MHKATESKDTAMWAVWVNGVLSDTLALKPNRGVSGTRPSGPPINKQPMADDWSDTSYSAC